MNLDDAVNAAMAGDQPEVELEAPEVEDAAPVEDAEPDMSVDGLLDAGLREIEGGGVEPPEHWSKDDSELFRSLPAASREAVLNWRTQVEKGAQARFEEAATMRKAAEELTSVLQPYEQDMQAAGLTPAQTVQQALQTVARLSQDPVGTLEVLARRLASEPGQAADVARRLGTALGVPIGVAAQQRGQAQDPTAQKVQVLEAKLQNYERAQQEAQQRHVMSVANAAGSKIQAFADAKAEDGTSLHPHFEAVRPLMGALVQAAAAAGETLDLDAAYQRAVWSREDLRPQLLAAQQAGQAKAAASQRANELAKARGARTPRSRSIDVPPEKGRSIDDLLDQGIAEMRLSA